jgi:hypothetical protein
MIKRIHNFYFFKKEASPRPAYKGTIGIIFMAWQGKAFSFIILFGYFFLFAFFLKAQRSASPYAYSLSF